MITEIEVLKRKAGNAYVAYMALLDSVDCGAQMLEVLKPEAYTHRMIFNNAMNRLSEIDPNCPKKRL